MIKVGDWVMHNITGERFEVTEYNDKYVWLRKENGFRDITTHETLYKWLYIEQKQRADELEHKLKKEIDESERQLRRWYEELKHADRLEKRWERIKSFIQLRKRQSKSESLDMEEILTGIIDKMDYLEEDGE